MRYSIDEMVKLKNGSIENCVIKNEENREIDMPDVNDNGNGYINSLVLASREERVALLKTGLTGKDVESLYLKFNDIMVIGINWQDLKSK